MRYAVGDIHGFRAEMRAALGAAGLIDGDGDWSGGADEVWFAGDLMDRGPDGVGVVSDIMRWQNQARDVGGFVGSVLGNHEVLALGMRRFAAATLPGSSGPDGPRSFALSWMVNGGQFSDQDALTVDMVEWLSALPAMLVIDGDLVLHSDTTSYLDWGDDPQSINRAVHGVVSDGSLEDCWELWRTMTLRYEFLGPEGPDKVRSMLDRTDARRLVHGHSLIADLLDVEPTSVDGPWSYADGLALAVDGGIYAGGPCLVVPLG